MAVGEEYFAMGEKGMPVVMPARILLLCRVETLVGKANADLMSKSKTSTNSVETSERRQLGIIVVLDCAQKERIAFPGIIVVLIGRGTVMNFRAVLLPSTLLLYVLGVNGAVAAAILVESNLLVIALDGWPNRERNLADEDSPS